MSRFIISGGGTGGHVFPAIAIAQAIRKKEPGADILFIGAKGKLEMEKVPAAGFPIEGLTIAGLIRRVTWKNLTFPFKLTGSLFKARLIIKKLNPDVVVGVGGYASGPTLRVATSMGKPALIQEQNSYPGITNRLLGKRVQTICVAYDGMSKYFPKEKIVLTGNPVRKDLISLPDHIPEAYRYFDFDPDKRTILVMGGSGGARAINESILTLLRHGLPEGVQLLWQTGKYYFDEVRERLRDTGYRMPDSLISPSTEPSGIGHQASTPPLTPPQQGRGMSRIKYQGSSIVPFIDRMDLAYSCADLVITRAGAIAISELCVVGKPAILIPSPNVAEDHQTKNALALVDKEAAVMISDKEAPERLPALISELMNDKKRLQQLSQNIKKLAIYDAAIRIAEEVFKLIQTKSKT